MLRFKTHTRVQWSVKAVAGSRRKLKVSKLNDDQLALVDSLATQLMENDPSLRIPDAYAKAESILERQK